MPLTPGTKLSQYEVDESMYHRTGNGFSSSKKAPGGKRGRFGWSRNWFHGLERLVLER